MPDAPHSPSANESDTERPEEASDNGPDLPTDPETLQTWVQIGMRRLIEAKEERDRARKNLRELRMMYNLEVEAKRNAQQKVKRLQEEYEQVKDALHSMYEMWKRAPSHRSAAELRADELEQEVKRLRSDLKKEKQKNASEQDAEEAERMIAAITEAAHRGRTWESGAELKRWLVHRFELKADTEKHRKSSARRVERVLHRHGVWVRPGKRGHTGDSVRKTVENCLEHSGFFNSDGAV